MTEQPYKKKLIEVALPLEAINKESAREKSIRHGHPSTLHLWWARRPLAACRAVLFASLVDDPSSLPEQFPTEEAQEQERQRLFRIIEELVKWENSNNEEVLETARAEIMRSTGGNPPPVYDPFCGGGSIPLEAQRLGLEAHASDLNPVAVLITKALIEIPPKFAGMPPVNPEARAKIGHGDGWRGAQGLAEDVRYYGRWMRDEAERRIGHLYPKVKLPKEHGGGEATVIAWLWARTVKCPNPACGAQMPLVRTFWLSTKAAKKAWLEPIVVTASKTVRFEVRTGEGGPPDGTMLTRAATCLVCRQVSKLPYIRSEAQAGRMDVVPLAMVVEGHRGRLYVPPEPDHEAIARSAHPKWKPAEKVSSPSHDVDRLPMYGMYTWGDAFTQRQLVALTSFSDLVAEARERVLADATAAGLPADGVSLNECGKGAMAYADAVATYLAFSLSKMADRGSSICTWFTERDSTRNTFARQAIPMSWDFAELNTLLGGTGSFAGAVDWTAESVEGMPSVPVRPGIVGQQDATSSPVGISWRVVSTDPPYYDNVGYADLSDFFYVWLRRSLGRVYSDLFSTMVTPKSQELVATAHRFNGSSTKAQQFFEAGLAKCFSHMREVQHSDYPLTVYYAFRQVETEISADGNSQVTGPVASTGWETMLEGLLTAGFSITGTWPMRSELSNRMVASGTNALASSIVLVCRPRRADAPSATRREFLSALKRELPDALQLLQHGNIAPVDLAQAAIGPGMAVFSRYSKVLEADGSPMPVRTALALINQTLDEVLAEQEGEFDADTRWALAWFEQYAMEEGPFGVAETLSKAKNTAVSALAEAGILQAKAGKVRLLRCDELPVDWEPAGDNTVWEVTQQLIRALEKEGEAGAAALLRKIGAAGEAARDLAYRLYSICERKKWAQEALAYNSLVIAWPEIARLAAQDGTVSQEALF